MSQSIFSAIGPTKHEQHLPYHFNGCMPMALSHVQHTILSTEQHCKCKQKTMSVQLRSSRSRTAGTSSSGVGRVIRSAANALLPSRMNEVRNGRARRSKGVSRNTSASAPYRIVVGYSGLTDIQVDNMVRIMPHHSQVFQNEMRTHQRFCIFLGKDGTTARGTYRLGS